MYGSVLGGKCRSEEIKREGMLERKGKLCKENKVKRRIGRIGNKREVKMSECSG